MPKELLHKQRNPALSSSEKSRTRENPAKRNQEHERILPKKSRTLHMRESCIKNFLILVSTLPKQTRTSMLITKPNPKADQ
jgi:hypothetical protein